MRRTLALAAVFGLAFVPLPASAQWLDFGVNCSSGTIQSCASFQTQARSYVDDAGAERTQVFVRARNLQAILSDGSDGGSILNRLGVVSPDLVDIRDENVLAVGAGQTIFAEGPTTVTGDPFTHWSMRRKSMSEGRVVWGVSSLSEEGGIEDCIGSSANPTSFFRTCHDGVPDGWVTFGFTVAGGFGIDQLQLDWGVRSISGVSPEEDPGSVVGRTCVLGECGEVTVTPEPLTVLLLGTGLAGIAGVAHRRRRRDGEDDERVD